MITRKIADWFLTEAGKKFCYYGCGVTATSVLLCNFLPHTLLLGKYEEIVALYKNGLSVPLSNKLRERFEKTLDMLDIDSVDRHLYKPFHCYGFNIMSAGSSYSKFGVIVGIPANFAYDNVNMVDKSKIKVNQESLVWDSEDGEKLLKSLVLSDNAQIYAIAKEIKYRQTAKPLIDTLNATLSVVLVYALSNNINTKFNLYAKPLGVRMIMYSFIGIFVFGSYAMLKDMSQLYYEEKIDAALKSKDSIFAEGGREYYTKLLERNKALRKLLGKEGEKLYSVQGNENSFIRTRNIPLVHRKTFFEEGRMSLNS